MGYELAKGCFVLYLATFGCHLSALSQGSKIQLIFKWTTILYHNTFILVQCASLSIYRYLHIALKVDPSWKNFTDYFFSWIWLRYSIGV